MCFAVFVLFYFHKFLANANFDNVTLSYCLPPTKFYYLTKFNTKKIKEKKRKKPIETHKHEHTHTHTKKTHTQTTELKRPEAVVLIWDNNQSI